jgi:diguanylate cyclase (GGDEF)-like protein
MGIGNKTSGGRLQWTGMMFWPLLALALIAATWLGAVRRNSELHGAVLQQGRDVVLSTAQAYDQYITRSIAQIDQISVQLRQSWEHSGGTLDLSELVREGLFHDAAFQCVAITDGEGRVVSSVRRQGCSKMATLTSIVAYHKSNNSSAMRIAAPELGEPQALVLFSRRLDTRDNDFAGVVILLVRADYLTDFYMPSTLGAGGSVAVMGTDMPWHSEKGGAGRITQRATMLARTAPEGAAVLQVSRSDRNGIPRLLGWSQSKVYPVTGLVTLPLASFFTPAEIAWEAARRDSIVVTVALLLFALLASLLTRRAADRYSAQENVRKAYRAATEGANDGFYTAAPVRDRSGKIRDFEIVDCNERGAHFYGLARRALIGKRLSQLQRGLVGDDLIDTYLRAMDNGFHEDERQMPALTLGGIAWGHRRIVRVGSGLAITLRDISERKSYMAELDRLSNEDALTGLPNRQWLTTFLPSALARAEGEVALLFVDLNDFKHVNDTHGHDVGDQLLAASARRLKSLLRPTDVVVRFGNDEFVVVLTPAEGDVHSSRVAERIVSAFAAPFSLATVRAMVGVSVGISVYPRDGTDGGVLVRHADIANDAARTDGNGHYRFYDPSLSRSLQGRLQLKQGLIDAITHDHFVLHYQPRVDALTGELCSMEALLRWEHPIHGMVPPGEFIPLAESSALILQIGEIVMHKACAQLNQWRKDGLRLVPVSINVSPKQFAQGELPAQLARCLALHQIEPSLLEVEITESAMMGGQGDVIAQLDAIRALGIKLHVDDFGTGYSSLSQLQKLKMDVLKVDRAFTAELGQSNEGKVFFQAIVSMAHALGMAVVAEGVETPLQLAILQDLACNEVQGYYVARPMPASAMAAMIMQRFLFQPPTTQFPQ